MVRSKHDWSGVWRSIGSITFISMLSVALFGLLYWVADLKSLQYSFRLFIGLLWVVATVLLLRRFTHIVQNEVPRDFLLLFLFIALVSGLCGVGDYADRRTSLFHECDSIVKDSLGSEEYIHSLFLVEVDTSMVGYYVYPKVHRHYQRYSSGSDITFEAYVAAPVKQSNGVYMIYHVSGDRHDYSFASDEKLNEYLHEFSVALRDTLQQHHYDSRCTTFQRINPNDEEYDYILKAVGNASISCYDTAFAIENHPVIIRPVYDVPLSGEPHVRVGYVICFAVCMGIIALILAFARTRRKKRKGNTNAGFELEKETVKYIKNPKNWPSVFIFLLPIIYYMIALALGYKESSSALDYGAISGYNLFVKGEWWRLVTSMLMHVNMIHLVSNLMGLFIILQFWCVVIPIYQGWTGLLVFFGTGIVSSLCCALFSDAVTVGASGAIMGMLGFPFGFMIDSKKLWTSTNKTILKVLAILIVPTILLSFTRSISLTGHVSGLLCGFIAGVIYCKLHVKEKK